MGGMGKLRVSAGTATPPLPSAASAAASGSASASAATRRRSAATSAIQTSSDEDHDDGPGHDVDGGAPALLAVDPHGGDDQDPGQRDRDEHLPAERHQLVVADPGQGAAQPEEAEHQDEHLGQEPEHRPPAAVRPRPDAGDRPGRAPAAEEQRGGERGDRDHVDVLGQLDQRELERGVLGVVAADQLALALGQVEGKPVGLADHRDEVDHERREKQHREPGRVVQGDPGHVEHRAVRLGGDDRRGGQRARVEEHRDERQAHRDLIADHLGRRAKRAEQRVGRPGRPAGQHDPVHAHRAHREDEQHRDWKVGELQRRLHGRKSRPQARTE